MQILLTKTPLPAAFFCAAILAGCSPEQNNGEAAATSCPARTAPIAAVQGDAPESRMVGQQVTVHGIVTLIQGGKGLFIEEPDSDDDERTSNAIYVEATQIASAIESGSLLSVSGTVAEIGEGRYPLTALTSVSDIIACSAGNPLPMTTAELPLTGLSREAREGMRIRFEDGLTVTGIYRLGDGQATLSGNGFQFVPTEIMQPGAEAAIQRTSNRAYVLPVSLPANMKDTGVLISGTPVKHVAGVMASDDRGLRLAVESISAEVPASVATPESAGDDALRFVGMNLYNYFNGDGNGQGFPTPRGAETLAEFNQQRARIGAAIKALDPHVIGVQELENDGFGPASAVQDFIKLAESVTGQSWAVTRPLDDDTGTDRITVGLFYRSDMLEAIRPAQTLTGGEFEKSRQPQAQLFQRLPDGEKILVVVNHLKSKGSCPDSGPDMNQRDGQGCWNPVRLASAKRMTAWTKSAAVAGGTDNILILGDMNAYRNEDPIAAIRNAGFTELLDDEQGEAYSFVFAGQRGTLDYAFASQGLLERVEQAFIWNVNAAFPARMELPQPWLRFSDHDPVVVDLVLRQSTTLD